MGWRTNALFAPHWRCWDDEWVAFDTGSGQSHQMDTLTAVTLMVMSSTNVEFPDLLASVADELQLPDIPALSTTMTDVLGKLVAAGLIEFSPA